MMKPSMKKANDEGNTSQIENVNTSQIGNGSYLTNNTSIEANTKPQI